MELSATLVTATSGAVETWPTIKSERVEFGEVDARDSTTNELKLKFVWPGKSRFRSTPASKNSPDCTKLAAVPLAEDLYGQGTGGACPVAPSSAVVFVTAVPMVELSVVPVAGIAPLFQVKDVIVAAPLREIRHQQEIAVHMRLGHAEVGRTVSVRLVELPPRLGNRVLEEPDTDDG